MSFTAIVVGMGSIAERHRANLKLMFPQARIYALTSSGRIPVGQLLNCDKFFRCLNEVPFPEIDLAIIASPATFHRQHTIPFVQHGIPTLIEKPVATTVEDARCIIQASQRKGCSVAVGYCLRFLPSSIFVKQAIEAGTLGKIYNIFIEVGQNLAQWRPGKKYQETVSAKHHLGGGALFELSHELDYCQWIFGPVQVHHAILRRSEQLNLEVEDAADIVASTESGGVVSIHLDLLQHQARRTCRIIGSEGAMDWDLIKNKVTLSDRQGLRVVFEDAQWDKNNMYIEMLSSFLSDGKKCVTSVATLHESLNVIELIDDIKAKHSI